MARDPGPNAPCPCGSGKKVKRCCGGVGAGSVAPPPSTPPADPHRAVHVADERLVGRILEAARARFGRRFDPVAEFEDVLHGDRSDLAFFIPWIAYHYRIDGATPLEHFLRRGRVTADERRWLEAQLSARLSYWEVTGVRAGESVSVRDLFTGEERTVVERTASRMVRQWDVLLTRVTDFDGTSYLCGVRSRLLPPSAAAAAVKAVKRALRVRRKIVPAELLASRDGVTALVSAFEAAIQELTTRASAAPVLQNTDGDAIRFTTDTFAVAPGSRDEVARQLRRIAGVEPDDDDDGLTFTKPGNRVNREWTNTVLGHLTFSDDGFTVESNSTKRANALRRMVEKACGDAVEHVSRRARTAASALKAAKAKGAPAPTPPELLPALREMKEKHYRAWLDTEIPALGGLTPRHAARRRRADLDALLKDIERRELELPVGERFDVALLRRELAM